jgi:hypothetical protein
MPAAMHPLAATHAQLWLSVTHAETPTLRHCHVGELLSKLRHELAFTALKSIGYSLNADESP